jgi:aldose 1-epimerase
MGEPFPAPLTGAQYEISAGGYRAVVTGLGAGIRELAHDGVPVIAGFPPDELPPGAAGQLLLPWPNRIDGGRYRFGGSDHQLDISEPGRGTAIHGLTRWASWRLVSHDPAAVTLALSLLGRPGYPFCLEVTAEYVVTADAGLRTVITARNAGSRPAPYGTGQHPYLTVGTPSVDEAVLQLPASRWLPVDERGIPAGPAADVAGTPYDFRAARPIGQTELDHPFTALDSDTTGRAWARLSGNGRQVALWAGEGYRWLQVFTGDALDPPHRRRAVAVEPMSCPPNAFATGTDVLTLAPGATVTHSWGAVVHELERGSGAA